MIYHSLSNLVDKTLALIASLGVHFSCEESYQNYFLLLFCQHFITVPAGLTEEMREDKLGFLIFEERKNALENVGDH
jgi:hypothetical protein